MHPSWQGLTQSALRREVAAAIHAQATDSLNFALLFHRYLPLVEGRDQQKLTLLLARAFAAGLRDPDRRALLRTVADRRRAAVAGITDASRAITITLQERLAIGFGVANVFGPGLLLDHLLGVPYLPATAIRGVARSTARQELAARHGIPFELTDFAPPAEDPPAAGRNGRAGRRPGGPTPLHLFDTLLEWWPPRADRSGEDSPSGEAGDRTEAGGSDSAGDDRVASARQALTATIDRLRSRAGIAFPDAVEWERLIATDADLIAYRLGFGSQSRAGRILFADCYPPEIQTLQPDVLNPHFPEYYRGYESDQRTYGGRPPGDYQNPVPVFFLTVPAGTALEGAIGRRGPDPEANGVPIGLIDRVVEWLDRGLLTWGIGAKTAVGYGAARVR